MVSEDWPAGNFWRRHSGTAIWSRLSDCGLAIAYIRPLNQVTAKQQVGPLKASAGGKTYEQQQKEAAQGGKIPQGSITDYFKRAVGQLLQQSEGSVLDINDLLAYRVRGRGVRV